MMPWFRLYSEFATDPKVQFLSETLQRRYIMLLCYKCNGELEKLSDEELAFALRITVEELVKTIEIFQEKGMIGPNREVIGWDKRQYKSDTSKERVKRHRDMKRKCNVTVTQCNGDVTAPDTDTDTDTERKKEENNPPTCPPKIRFDPKSNQLTGITKEQFSAWKEAYPGIDVHQELLKMEQWLTANPGRRKQNYGRFIVNWLSRAKQDLGDRKVSKGPGGELFV
ncbi:MAG: hypothetical protein AB7G80_09180 [Dongiaceae bacterium]